MEIAGRSVPAAYRCAGDFVPYPCPIRALTIGKEWISMVIIGVRYLLSRWKCHRFTRDVADLRSGFSFAGVAQW